MPHMAYLLTVHVAPASRDEGSASAVQMYLAYAHGSPGRGHPRADDAALAAQPQEAVVDRAFGEHDAGASAVDDHRVHLLALAAAHHHRPGPAFHVKLRRRLPRLHHRE